MRRTPVVEVIDEQMASILRRQSGAEKLQRVDDMNNSARELIEASVRRMHPDFTDQDVSQEVARRIAGDND